MIIRKAVIITAISFLMGMLSMLTVVLFLKSTDNMEFCISCHTTMGQQYEGLKKSRHYKNVNGVRVGCPSCHVPHETGPLIKAKVMAVKDVVMQIRLQLAEMTRSANAKDEYEKMIPVLAKRVREGFLKNDSAQCKTCHSFESFKEDLKPHIRAREQKITCIVCHYNLVHHDDIPWPEMEKDEEEG